MGDGGGEESMGEQGMCEGVRLWGCGGVRVRGVYEGVGVMVVSG